MSLRHLQYEQFVDFIIRKYLAFGKRISDEELAGLVNRFFSENPLGQPYYGERPRSRNAAIDVDSFNSMLAAAYINVHSMFEQIDRQIDANIDLTTVALSELALLDARRGELESKVDDLLLSQFNTEGYLSAVSDTFSTVNNVDLALTSAFVDTLSGEVILPYLPQGSTVVDLTNTNTPAIKCFAREDISKQLSYEELYEFNRATDGLSNTAWAIECRRPISEDDGVTVRIPIEIGSRQAKIDVSQVNIFLFGIQETQVSVEKTLIFDSNQDRNVVPFSREIKTGTNKLIFLNSDPGQGVEAITIQMTKHRPDYLDRDTQQGVYRFGMKEISMVRQVYQSQASLVTKPLSPYNDTEEVIDKVSLRVDHSIPHSCSITYFVAPDNEQAVDISDFEWQEILPLDKSNKSSSIVNFEGTRTHSYMIRSAERSIEDISLITLNPDTNDQDLVNPTSSYFPKFDTYRIARFGEDFVPGSLTLEEGVNTTRISHAGLDSRNISDTFNFWQPKFEDPDTYFRDIGQTDAGNNFFYGVNVGENSKSVYVETNLYSDIDRSTFYKSISKSNRNAATWDVRVYLNGRQIADLPSGTMEVSAPIKINKGRNNIVVAVNIPAPTAAVANPYIGSLIFDLSEYGIIKLGDMTYVDVHKFKDGGYRDNTNVSPNKWFTIHNGELVTRSKITDNYRVSFKKSTGSGPTAVRLRAEMSRPTSNPAASPSVDAYRLRFSYDT